MKTATWLLAGAIAAIVAAANLGLAQPVFDAVHRVPWGDKICHFLLLGGLCYLLCMSIAPRYRSRQYLVVAAVVVVMALASMMEEFSQQWLAYRTFSLVDLASNLAGILVLGSLAAAHLWARGRRAPVTPAPEPATESR